MTQYLLRICVIGTFFGLSDARAAMSEVDFSLLVLSTVLIAAGGYIINDIFDVHTDKTNKPAKVLIGKSISPGNGMMLYRVVTLSGIIIGFYLAYKVNYLILGFVFVFIATLLWYYSKSFKKKPLLGNTIVSLLSAMVVLIVWLVEFFALLANPLIYAETMKHLNTVGLIVGGYAFFAFLVSLSREMVKDIEDIEGDSSQNYATLPIVIGLKKTKIFVIIVAMLTVVLLAFGQYWLFLNNYMFVFWYLMVAVQTLLIFFLYQLYIARTKEDFHFLSNATKVIMVAGILSMQLFYISF